jgi:mono/diheme cytochrome c family protein
MLTSIRQTAKHLILSLTTLIVTSSAMAQTPAVSYLDQAWSAQDRADYYWTSQGSALVSYDIYLALEAAGTTDLFSSSTHSDRMGLLAEPLNLAQNPDNLPVGVAKASITVGQYRGTYAGLTCAACHTGQVQYQGKQIRIEGGASNRIALWDWLHSLSTSLDRASTDPEKYQALAERIRAKGSVDEADLRKRLLADTALLRERVDTIMLVPFNPGPGRMDALGLIHNAFVGGGTGTLENMRLAAAPVKPPFLWNAPQSAWIQWSGVSENPLARNFGETLGVFARYDLKSANPDSGLFEATTDIKGMVKLEQLLRRLAPPKWPEELLGKLDQGRIKDGEKLFAQHCIECHTTYPYRWSEPRKGGVRAIENALVPQRIVGTDGTQLAGVTFDPNPLIATKALAAYFGGKNAVSQGEFVSKITTQLLERALKQSGPFTPIEMADMTGYAPSGTSAPVQSYKAAPRDGVWATGPFLHNGSVPNIYELLSPAAERSKTFYVGRDFDPIKLGLDMAGNKEGYFFETTRIGNSNAGHSFEATKGPGVVGPAFSESERFALIEYLKSIPNQAARVTPYGGPKDPLVANEDPLWFNKKHPYSSPAPSPVSAK